MEWLTCRWQRTGTQAVCNDFMELSMSGLAGLNFESISAGGPVIKLFDFSRTVGNDNRDQSETENSGVGSSSSSGGSGNSYETGDVDGGSHGGSASGKNGSASVSGDATASNSGGGESESGGGFSEVASLFGGGKSVTKG
jgi:hypothetical protein